MIHTTKDGEIMQTSRMADSHVENMIKFLLRKLTVAKKVINKKENTFTGIINKTFVDSDQAEDFAVNFEGIFAVYILEASVRGLDVEKHVKIYAELIERKEAVVDDDLLLIEDHTCGPNFNDVYGD